MMLKKLTLLAAVLAALCACTNLPTRPPLALSVESSPVVYDGSLSGQPTDLVVVLVPSQDPNLPGLALQPGESLRVQLPSSFKRDDRVSIRADSDLNLALAKGWPQSDAALTGSYQVEFDPSSNTLAATALVPLGRDRAGLPGVKALLVRGHTFINPSAGDYPVRVEQRSATGALMQIWNGTVTVVAQSHGPRLAPSNLHLWPGSNSDFQAVLPGRTGPVPLGVMLWGPDGAPLNDVGLAAPDLKRYPQYTGGLLVQDQQHERWPDAAQGTVVGGVILDAPEAARGHWVGNFGRADGHAVRSGELRREFGVGSAQVSAPIAGLLGILFHAGDKPGLYFVTVELLGGNHYRFTIPVVTL